MKKFFRLFLLIIVFSIFGLVADESFQLEENVKNVNEKILGLKSDLEKKINEVNNLYSKNATDDDFKKLLDEIKEIKKNISNLQENFRKDYVRDGIKNDESYAFWDQGETTISQMIMEIGSQDYLYVIPNELATMKINVYSTIAIPHESWDDILQLILSYNGIGIKKINPFLRQLYILKHDPSHIDAIINKSQDLNLANDGSILCYIFSPKPEDMKSILAFFERFSDLKQTTIHPIRTDIIVIGSKENISRLVNLYEAVYNKSDGKVVKVLPLTKIASSEADKILQAFFSQTQKNRPSFYQGAIEELTIIPQGSSIILIGEANFVDRAENIILDLEKQLDDPSEMTIFWYSCKNSDPQELADILDKLYSSMSSLKIDDQNKIDTYLKDQAVPSVGPKPKLASVSNASPAKEKSSSNFIVDAKTGSILMVVRKDELDKLKILLKKLDQPKKMVRIDVLLVERKIQNKNQSGINLLKIGSPSSNKDHGTSNQKKTIFGFEDNKDKRGILDFILSRPMSKHLPSFDLVLSFLMAQDDMHLSDCPSVLAINQTPATISVLDEISIYNGTVQSDPNSNKIESYTRSKYGTEITLTPTIHAPDEADDDQNGFVTLHTDVTFDTIKSNDNQPKVTKRHIENEVRVADGETIILGGLRRKSGSNDSEKIPFLGEIPGIGKLFGTTKHEDSSSEMFIFITPHIIKDPKIDVEKQKKFDLQKRQGDLDEFLKELDFAKNLEKKKIFENSLKLFFDK